MKKAILLLAGAIIAIGWTLSLIPASENTEPAPDVTVDRIVSQLRTVEELASLKVAVSGIITGTQPGSRFWQGQSRMVLLVRGTAIYSVDLSRAEVVVEGNTVTITLPQPRISDHWVDVEHTETWQRQTGRFRRDEGMNLEAACWASAKAMVLEGATSDAHQDMARAQAGRTIREVVHAAVPENAVRVIWRGG